MNVEELSLLLPDIPRFYTALAEWMACLICMAEMKRRIKGVKFAAVSAAALVIQSAFLVMTKGLGNAWWMLCMAAAVGLMYLFIITCCQVTRRDAGYYCVRAFVAAEFAASLEWQLDCYFYYAVGWDAWWLRALWLVLVYGTVFTILWWIYRDHTQKDEALMVTDKELISCVIIGLAIFLMSNIGFVSLKTPFSGRYMTEVFNVRTIIDLGGVAILYAYHVQRVDLRVRQELEGVQNILHQQYMQYQQSQEAMDMINYKYHDLKHHIIALKAEENDQQRRQYLDNMEEEIRAYEAQDKTGNKVLDTLLTAKHLQCMQNGISMTCVADGTLFDFMDVMDICSIFGNALDNAIEYEKRIQEKEKRLIHVTVSEQKQFLIARFENYCEDKIDFREGLPATTKEDVRFHGYGLKSLRYTVKKYGGEVDMGVTDNWFHLNILIPLEQD